MNSYSSVNGPTNPGRHLYMVTACCRQTIRERDTSLLGYALISATIPANAVQGTLSVSPVPSDKNGNRTANAVSLDAMAPVSGSIGADVKCVWSVREGKRHAKSGSCSVLLSQDF